MAGPLREGHLGDCHADSASCRCRSCRLVPSHAAAEPTTYRFFLAREAATLIMFGRFDFLNGERFSLSCHCRVSIVLGTSKTIKLYEVPNKVPKRFGFN